MHLLYRPSLAHVSRFDARRLDRTKTTVACAAKVGSLFHRRRRENGSVLALWLLGVRMPVNQAFGTGFAHDSKSESHLNKHRASEIPKGRIL